MTLYLVIQKWNSGKNSALQKKYENLNYLSYTLFNKVIAVIVHTPSFFIYIHLSV